MATAGKPPGSKTPASTEITSTDSSKKQEQRNRENDLFRKMIRNPMPMAPDLPPKK